MTVQHLYRICCDRCPAVFDTVRRLARHTAQQAGWTYTAAGRDLCPNCSPTPTGFGATNSTIQETENER